MNEPNKYSTFVMDADNFTVNPFVAKVEPTKEGDSLAYKITYSVPLPRFTEFIQDLPDEMLQDMTFKVKR